MNLRCQLRPSAISLSLLAAALALPSAAAAQTLAQPSSAPPSTQQSGTVQPVQMPANYDYDEKTPSDNLSSTYIPLDSWVYPAAMRLYSLGYLDTSFITMRPWTRRSLQHMLEATQDDIVSDEDAQAMEILVKLQAYVADETTPANTVRGTLYGLDTVYTRLTGIKGPPLRDSFHLGQTIANDYGRPYQTGFNNITGFSTVNEMGPFSLYIRGEYQHSPAGAGYSQAMAAELSTIDLVDWSGYNLKSATIPAGPIPAQNPFRLQEATLSFHIWGHEISGGKSDDWVGPGAGGGMAWANNAENIYSFRINRVEPLHIPLFSRIFGDVRYDFFVGSLKGHTYFNSPWIHSETIEVHPTANFQFGFQRSVIWGGEGHEPVTLHTFLRSFFSLEDTESDPASKGTSADPGARFSTFNFAWRLPFFTHSLTLYTDSMVHDDVTPPSAPRRAAYRPGIYLSQFPHFHKLDLRVEAANTDISTLRSMNGQFNYWETVVRQGYTNKGFILGDSVGREAKMGQVWLTYHLSGNEWVQLEFMHKKTPKDFVPGGTSQTQFMAQVVKRFGKEKNIELNASVQFERWMAPVPQVTGANPLQISGGPLYYTTPQHDTVAAFQVTWYPRLHSIAAPLKRK